MFLLSGILNILSGVLMIWWAFGELNNVLLVIPAVLLLFAGSLCVAKAAKRQEKHG